MGRRRNRRARRRQASRPADAPVLDDELEWVWVGDQRMFVVGYTPGGVPYGSVEGLDDVIDGGS